MSTALPTGDDGARLTLVRERLYTAVIGDILDTLGRVAQFLPPAIKPMRADMVVVGRAMPVLIGAVSHSPSRPFGKLTEALDQLAPHEVYVVHGADLPCAAWGEILTATAIARGAEGAVIHGFHRDTRKVLAQGWPVFSHGAYAQDAAVRSEVLDYRVPIDIGGVTVCAGALVVGDQDGVVVVPPDVEDEVLERALEKAATEGTVLAAIRDGMSSTQAFAKYGVL